MLVILAIAAIAILACVVLVSLGRGGELTEFPPDVPPLDLPEPGQLTAVDFMALQLPVNLVGYHTGSVDETLRRAASAISARDTRIAVLEQRVSELLSSRLHARQEVYAAPGAGLRTEHAPEPPRAGRELPEQGDPVSASGAAVAWDGGVEPATRPEEPEWRIRAAEPSANGTNADEKPPEDADPGTDEKPPEDADPGTDVTSQEDADPGHDGRTPEHASEEKEQKPDAEGEPDEPVRASSGKEGDARP
ncbi:MAG TPA: hypothetical protein VFV66_18795 [Nonomuraea sp.]|nr:hypothetical protein [Nonomuraea sp.]